MKRNPATASSASKRWQGQQLAPVMSIIATQEQQQRHQREAMRLPTKATKQRAMLALAVLVLAAQQETQWGWLQQGLTRWQQQQQMQLVGFTGSLWQRAGG
jgi:pantothenate kinase